MSKFVKSPSTSSPYDPCLILPFVTEAAEVLELGLTPMFCEEIARDLADIVGRVPAAEVKYEAG